MTHPESTVEMADFLAENLDFCSGWDRERLLDWVQWFVNNNRYYAVKAKGQLVGLTLLRMVDTEKQCHEHYKDTEGGICYVEACVSRFPRCINRMYEMVWNRWSQTAHSMAWMRHKYNNRATVVDMSRIKRRFLG